MLKNIRVIKMKYFKIYKNKIEGRIDPLFYSFSQDEDFVFQLVSIKEIIEYIKTGFAAGKSNQAKTKEGIIQIRPTNIDEEGNLYFQKNIYLPDKLRNIKKDDLIKKGEILFNNTNSQELVGKTTYFNLNGDFFCSNHITRIKVNFKKVLPKYLWIILNYLQRKNLFFRICTNWNNQSGVNVNLLKEVKILLPPFETQSRIVELMDNAYNLKKQKEIEAHQILNSINDYVIDELGIKLPELKGKMCFAVNSKETKGKRIDPKGYSVIPRGILKAIKKAKYSQKLLSNLIEKIISGEWGEDIEEVKDRENYVLVKVLRNTNFCNQGNLDFSKVAQRMIDKEKYEKVRLKNGDILIEKSGGSPIQPVGRVAIIEDVKTDFAFSNFLQVIRIKKQECLPEYLFCFLKTLYSLNYMEYIQNQTTGIKNLIIEEFLSIPISLPPMNKQREIIREYKTKLVAAEQLKLEAKNILEKAKLNVERIILGEEKI